MDNIGGQAKRGPGRPPKPAGERVAKDAAYWRERKGAQREAKAINPKIMTAG